MMPEGPSIPATSGLGSHDFVFQMGVTQLLVQTHGLPPVCVFFVCLYIFIS